MGTPRVLILGHLFIRHAHWLIESNPGQMDLAFRLLSSAIISWEGVGGRMVTKTDKVRPTHPSLVPPRYSYCATRH